MLLWRPSEHEELTPAGWSQSRAEAELAAIVADAESAVVDGLWPGHPLDDEEGNRLRTLYIGGAGVIWGLHRLGASIDAPRIIAALIDQYREAPDFGHEARHASLWMGETGLLVVAARAGSPAADEGRLRELVRQNRDHDTWGADVGLSGNDARR
jgi:hypothetical protein